MDEQTYNSMSRLISLYFSYVFLSKGERSELIGGLQGARPLQPAKALYKFKLISQIYKKFLLTPLTLNPGFVSGRDVNSNLNTL